MAESSSLVHQKIVSNDIQAIQVEESNLEPIIADQIDKIFPEEEAQLQQDLITTSKTLYKKSNRGKISVILWTREQLEIIGAVFKGLTDQSKESKPIRIHVIGAKGTGKTMLMVHLAQLARCIYHKKPTDDQVVVCDASENAKILFSNLEQSFQGSGIKLMKCIPEVSEIIEKGIIFVDEDPFNFLSGDAKISSWIDTEAHLCVFSSTNVTTAETARNLIPFYLSYIMRSTKQVQIFTNNYMWNSKSMDMDFHGLPSHTLDGTNRPDIIYVPSTNAPTNATNASELQPFMEKCVETVMRYSALSSSILVIYDFISTKCLIEILSILETKQVELSSICLNINSDKKGRNIYQSFEWSRLTRSTGVSFKLLLLCSSVRFSQKKKNSE